MFGKLTIQTFQKLLRKKLISVSLISEMIYSRIIDSFYKNFNESLILQKLAKKRVSILNKVKEIVNCFPNIKTLDKIIESIDFNDQRNRNVYLYII